MLAKFVDAILHRLGFVWRSFGSPRIAGDEKAVRAVKSAWASRRRKMPGLGVNAVPGETGPWWKKLAPNVIIAVSGLIVAVLVISILIISFATGDKDDDSPAGVSSGAPSPTEFAGPVFLTEVAALSSAVAAARENGLISNDFAHIARRIQFGAFADAIGETYRADRGLLAAPSDTEVWAFAFSGDVEFQLIGGETVKYDNLTVVLDALTGQVYRVEAFYGEYESEARAPAWLRPPTPTPAPRPDAG